MWKKDTAETTPTPAPRSITTATAERPPARAAANATSTVACIGASLRIKGEIHGAEDLLVEGHCEGLIQLDNHTVTVGPSGRVEGDVIAKLIAIEGEVIGNLVGEQEVVVRAHGRVEGNLRAPRINLQDGCHFQGSIDMRGSYPKTEGKPDAKAEAKVEARVAVKIETKTEAKTDNRLDRPQLDRQKGSDGAVARSDSSDGRAPAPASGGQVAKAPSLR